jgi:mono/diheme cytochrome c family protein
MILIALVGIGCVIFAALFFAAGNWMALAKAKKLKNPIVPNTQVLAEGKQIYGKHCETCHGEKGDGKGQKAAELSTAPTKFTDAKKMNGVADGELFWQITKGRQPMPAFEDKLTPDQRWESVDFIRTFAMKSTPASPEASSPPN